MKKTVSLLFGIMISLAFYVPCLAAEFENPPIVDGAGYLTEGQLTELSDKLEAVRRTFHFDVAVYTEPEMSGSDEMETADDIYDYIGYGAGENDDGILFYISANPRRYWFTTHAQGMWVFNDNGIAYLEAEIQPLLAEGNYAAAINRYIELTDALLEMAANGEPYHEVPTTALYVVFVLGFAILFPLLLAFIMTKIKLAKMKTAVENDYAASYVREGSKCLEVSRDIFLYSHITRREKPKHNHSSGHTSSSGRTHGGGGGSF